MPQYTYSNPNDETETVDIFQSMNETHEYERDGVKWKRVWTKPTASTDTKLDPFSKKDFLRATSKPDTLGSIWDRAKEASIKRAEKNGVDEVAQKYHSDAVKKRGGKHVIQQEHKKR